ncbi:MAG: type II toxin-antitoxin system HicB family antitoxin [Phototrophicaceae bacterium]|jgi:predicted RNase H-like HicB family nuclease
MIQLHQKTASDYLHLPYHLLITPDDEGFGVSVIELEGCYTHAQRWEDIPAQVSEAQSLWITVMLEDGKIIPEPHP